MSNSAFVDYLTVVCAGDILEQRLRDRPAWRQAGVPAFIDTMRTFNAYLRANASTLTPPITLLDTSPHDHHREHGSGHGMDTRATAVANHGPISR